jgi:hypothetical protein
MRRRSHRRGRAILTDDRGRPLDKPVRSDFTSDVEYVRAFHAWRDKVTSTANAAFDAAFRKTMRRSR